MLASASAFNAYVGIAVDVVCFFMALLSFRGISTPSLKAQGEQRRSSLFNIPRDNPSISISFGGGLLASGEMVMRRFSYGTGHGFAFQISAAYWTMVRSLENFPELAIFKITLRAHSSPSV